MKLKLQGNRNNGHFCLFFSLASLAMRILFGIYSALYIYALSERMVKSRALSLQEYFRSRLEAQKLKSHIPIEYGVTLYIYIK